MTKKRRLAIIVAVAVVVLGVCAVSAYAALSDDNTPPVTTSDAVAAYWGDATITLTATDNANGVAYIYYHVDGDHQYTHMFRTATDAAPYTVTIPAPASGTATHTLKFWSQDGAGNVEAAHTVDLSISVDTSKPVVKAFAASVARGKTATLKYSVADAAPTQGKAVVTIAVKNAAGKTVKSIPAVTVTLGAHSAKLAVPKSWKAGTYHFFVSAKDMAGNAQVKVASAKLVVK